jgi:hypothetical protein
MNQNTNTINIIMIKTPFNIVTSLLIIAAFILISGCGGSTSSKCKFCGGDGIIFQECATCKGEGRVTIKDNGFLSETDVCPSCKGRSAPARMCPYHKK